MLWEKSQIDQQAFGSAHEDYAAFEAINLAERKRIRVLDVGCFDGVNTYLKFSPYTSIEEVVGLDSRSAALAEAAARIDDKRFSFLNTTLESYRPKNDERFDLVYFSYTLHHMGDAQAALKKAYALLAPGGFVMVKTVDDALAVSYPDPLKVMHRLFELYEGQVLSRTSLATHTDRYNGQKCYTFLKQAGFENVRVRIFNVDTTGKTLEQRRELFERCTCSRYAAPGGVAEDATKEINDLVQAWGTLFESEEYFFSSASMVVLGQKPKSGEGLWQYAGPLFGDESSPTKASSVPKKEKVHDQIITLCSLRERDLGAVMGIEIASFRDPWTPLAFALDLRHNGHSHYQAALVQNKLVGYAGWWHTPQGAVIVRIAVDPQQRGGGVGRALVQEVVCQAEARDCATVSLEVRASNEGARSFYERLGFREAAVRGGYYEDPPDDAIVMVRALKD